MMYGHQVDRGWSTGGLVLGMLISAVAGASLGLLFAPQRGSDARRTLAGVATRVRSRLEIAGWVEPRVAGDRLARPSQDVEGV